MSGDNERQREVMRLIRQGLIAWALAHALAATMLLYAIHKPDPAGAKAWSYVLIGLGPVTVAGIYLEARAIWRGKEDTEFGAAIGAAAIMGAVALLAWYLG